MEKIEWNKINYFIETFDLNDILNFTDDEILDKVESL